MIKRFCLADPDAWLAAHFGPEQAPKLAKQYAKQWRVFESILRMSLYRAAKTENAAIQIKSLPVSLPPRPDAPLPSSPIPIETYTFHFTPSEPGQMFPIWIDSFVHLDGAFRFIGLGGEPFWSAPKLDSGTAGVTGGMSNLGPPSRIRVGSAVMKAKLINEVAPKYPPEAKKQKIEGTVELQTLIAKDGAVQEVTVVSGDPLLVDAAVRAVRQWRYQPTLLNGKPVEVLTMIVVVFKLGAPRPALN